MEEDKINVLVLHDRSEWPEVYVEHLNRVGLHANLLQDPVECLGRVKQGLGGVDVVLLHKDLGRHWLKKTNITSDMVIEAIHEENPFVRVGIVSGEYPHGKKHVLKMEADFYLGALNIYEQWTLDQLRKGIVSPEEQVRRGKTVETPPLQAFNIERKY